MIVGRWYVRLAAVWHCYLPLCIYIYKKKILYCVSISILYFSKPDIDKLEWSTIPACPSLMCSFNRGNIEGTNSSKVCFYDWFCRFT